jgi:hypothetical protein
MKAKEKERRKKGRGIREGGREEGCNEDTMTLDHGNHS